MADFVGLGADIVNNFYDSFLCVKMLPKSCGKCDSPDIGANLEFEMHFSTVQREIMDHRVSVGLTGGELLLDLGEANCKTMHPEPDIETMVIIKERKGSSFSAELKKKGSFVTIERDDSAEVQKRFVRVWPSGIGTSKPAWNFRSYDGQLLIGHLPKLKSVINSNPLFACRCQFRFITVPADWDYDYQIHQRVSGLHRWHLERAIKKKASALLVLYSRSAIISEDIWRCPVFRSRENA